MISAIKTIRDLLIADPIVNGIVGNDVYPLLNPEDSTLPSITLQRLQTDPENVLKGAAPLNANHVIASIWCAKYQDALTLRDAARAVLETNGLLLEQETEDYDPVVRTYRISQQWLIWT